MQFNENRYRLALEAAQMGTWDCDLSSGKLFWSEIHEKIFGFRHGTFPGTLEAFKKCVDPDDLPGLMQAGEQSIKSGKPFKSEYRVIWPDGSKHWIGSHGRCEYDTAGKPTRLIGLVFDLTERKQLEAQLRQAQKLEAIGQLAGGIAHDFNNMLAAIMMHISILKMSSELQNQVRSALDDISNEAQRAAGMTRQLLMFSRRSVLSKIPVNVNDIVTNLMKMLRRLIREDITLIFEGTTSLPSVEADTTLMEQVLINLVVNARDAMPKGGKISITTSLHSFDEVQSAFDSNRKPGLFVCISVSDTGCGMNAETQKRIFEPFFTTKDPGKGTGLGLATVYGIIAQHNGWIEVESKLGIGSTFNIYLPGVSFCREIPKKKDANPPLRGGQEVILLVEDEEKVRQLISQMLRSLGYTVHEAGNSQEALTIWKLQSTQIQLLITDMVMPESITGLELTEKLQNEKPGLKAIISSGYSLEIAKAGVLRRPDIVYLPKPYDAATLAEVVRNFLDKTVLSSGDSGAQESYLSELESRPLTKEMLSFIPETLKKQLSDATVCGRYFQLTELIQQISAKNSIVGHKLKEHADKFEYEVLIELLS